MNQSQADKSKATIARNLTRLRVHKNMSVTDLANASGIHRIQIHRYETESSLATMATLAALAKALNIKVPELLA